MRHESLGMRDVGEMTYPQHCLRKRDRSEGEQERGCQCKTPKRFEQSRRRTGRSEFRHEKSPLPPFDTGGRLRSKGNSPPLMRMTKREAPCGQQGAMNKFNFTSVRDAVEFCFAISPGREMCLLCPQAHLSAMLRPARNYRGRTDLGADSKINRPADAELRRAALWPKADQASCGGMSAPGGSRRSV